MKRTNKAFTLVELIIVIAVIGVLAAILIPVFSNVIEKSNKSSALTDAKNALEIYIAEAIDYTGGIPVGDGSIFKIRKADKNWYFTYFDSCLHEGSGAPNSNPLRPLPVPAGSVKCMASNSYYIAEQDASTLIYDTLPDTVIIYNTGANATYTPPTNEPDFDGEYIVITRAEQLTTEFFTENGMGEKYKLGNDITLSDSFTPIDGVFSGELNGNGKTISQLTINEPDTIAVGLFRRVEGARMYDFTLGVDNITGKGYVGTVCGRAINTVFTNIHVVITGNVTDVAIGGDDTFSGYGELGGFCSTALGVTVSRCSVQGKVSCANHTGCLGGMFSQLRGSVSQCFFSGTISGDFSGGIAGHLSNATVRDCYTRVSFEDADMVCGIAEIGINDTANRIENCVTVCTGLSREGHSGSAETAGFVINYHHTTDVINCYILADDELTQHPYTMAGSHENVSLNGTAVVSFTQASCPALSTAVWDLSGTYPALVNNLE